MPSGYKASKRCESLIKHTAHNYGGDHTPEYYHADKRTHDMWLRYREEGEGEAKASYLAWKWAAGESDKWALDHGKVPPQQAEDSDRFHASKIDTMSMDIESDCRWVLAAMGSKGILEKHCPSPSAWALFQQAREKGNQKDVIQWCLKYIRPMPNRDGLADEPEEQERGLDSLIEEGK